MPIASYLANRSEQAPHLLTLGHGERLTRQRSRLSALGSCGESPYDAAVRCCGRCGSCDTVTRGRQSMVHKGTTRFDGAPGRPKVVLALTGRPRVVKRAPPRRSLFVALCRIHAMGLLTFGLSTACRVGGNSSSCRRGGSSPACRRSTSVAKRDEHGTRDRTDRSQQAL